MKEFATNITSVLNQSNIEYLIIGGFAEIIYGTKLQTRDLDILIGKSPENLAKFEAFINSEQLISNFRNNQIIRIKGKPFCIDFHPKIDGVKTISAFENSARIKFNGDEFNVLSKKDLETNLFVSKQISNGIR